MKTKMFEQILTPVNCLLGIVIITCLSYVLLEIALKVIIAHAIGQSVKKIKDWDESQKNENDTH